MHIFEPQHFVKVPLKDLPGRFLYQSYSLLTASQGEAEIVATYHLTSVPKFAGDGVVVAKPFAQIGEYE